MEIPMRNLGIGLLLLAGLMSVQGQDTGAVEGFVGFGTDYPRRQMITVTSDAQVCGSSLLDEEFVVDEETHGLANTVIYWQLPAGQNPAAGNGDVTILSQSGCRYEPHVQVASAGSETLRVLNNDGILHNIHVYDEDENTLFNFAQPGFKKQIDKPLPHNQVIYVKCDVHQWMSAYILVLDHARSTITDEKGQYRLENIAPGRQRISIWHEGIGTTSKVVLVEAGQVVQLDFVIGK